MRILAICGSLRRASTNAVVLEAAARLAAPTMTVALSDHVRALPHYDADLDVDPPPPAVARLRDDVAASDALLFSSPEYAHGMPGSLKNLLDWLVPSPAIVAKAVGVINASPLATLADAALRETLRVMSARVVADACVRVPIVDKRMEVDAVVADARLGATLAAALRALAAGVAA